MPDMHWYRGSLHNHTNLSDGDSSPQVVADWYRRNGYQFIVFTDHNRITRLDTGASDFQVFPGEEVTARINDGETAIHINAFGLERVVDPISNGDVVSTLQANIDAILGAGGIPSINHPNYTWAFTHRELAQVKGAPLMEVHNAHPVVNTAGGAGRPGCEEIWDKVLGTGMRIFGVATDDSHHLQGDFTPKRGNPGRAWVVVRATHLDQKAVLDSLLSGDFYSSTGVSLASLEADQRRVALRCQQERDFVYAVEFIGRRGRRLQKSYGLESEYRLRGDEGYVRAVVNCSDGSKAWTQPVFV